MGVSVGMGGWWYFTSLSTPAPSHQPSSEKQSPPPRQSPSLAPQIIAAWEGGNPDLAQKLKEQINSPREMNRLIEAQSKLKKRWLAQFRQSLAQQDLNLAGKYYSKFIRLFPTSPEVRKISEEIDRLTTFFKYYNLARKSYNRKEYGQTSAHLTRALERSDSGPYFNLAQYLTEDAYWSSVQETEFKMAGESEQNKEWAKAWKIYDQVSRCPTPLHPTNWNLARHFEEIRSRARRHKKRIAAKTPALAGEKVWERKLWNSPRKGKYNTVAPLVQKNDLLMVIGREGVVKVYDWNSGKEVDKLETKGELWGAPALWDKSYMWGCTDHRVYEWVPRWSQPRTFDVSGGVWGGVDRAGSMFVFATTKGKVETIGIDYEHRDKPVYKWTFSAEGAIYGPLLAEKGPRFWGWIYFGDERGFIYALENRVGGDNRPRLQWKASTGYAIRAQPAMGEEHIYVAGGDGYIRGLARKTGEEKWKFFLGQPPEELWKRKVWPGPHRHGKTVLQPGWNGGMYGLDEATGKKLWHLPTQGKICTTPVAVKDQAFFGCADGKVYAVDANTGAVQWKFDAKAPIWSRPYVYPGRLYVVNDQGVIYRLK